MVDTLKAQSPLLQYACKNNSEKGKYWIYDNNIINWIILEKEYKIRKFMDSSTAPSSRRGGGKKFFEKGEVLKRYDNNIII